MDGLNNWNLYGVVCETVCSKVSLTNNDKERIWALSLLFLNSYIISSSSSSSSSIRQSTFYSSISASK